ncbi:MAG: hypothetical protein L0Z50_41790 [Verrucomicrobiales bacterium]|nr:hypothetical protein [Verrucomicrobiales bacterium]
MERQGQLIKPCDLLTAGQALASGLVLMTNDPLLPSRILPSDYPGQQARWPPANQGRRRVEVPRDAGRQLRTFNQHR